MTAHPFGRHNIGIPTYDFLTLQILQHKLPSLTYMFGLCIRIIILTILSVQIVYCSTFIQFISKPGMHCAVYSWTRKLYQYFVLQGAMFVIYLFFFSFFFCSATVHHDLHVLCQAKYIAFILCVCMYETVFLN